MKKHLIAVVFLTIVFAQPVRAEDAPLAIHSADIRGDDIVFSLGGDLWLASTHGDIARQITSGDAIDEDPHFSPDGRMIAFTRRSNQNTDVYIYEIDSGSIERLTWHPDVDTARGWTPDGRVLFESQRGGFFFPSLRTIGPGSPVDEVLPLQVGINGAISPDGKTLAYEPYTKDFRIMRHHRGGGQGEIRLVTLGSPDAATRIANVDGNIYDPVWCGGGLYCIADLDGTMNLYRISGSQLEKLTSFEKWDIRDIEGDERRIIMVQNGRLHLYDTADGSTSIITLNMPPADIPETTTEPPRQAPPTMHASPDGTRVVLEIRGDIVVLNEDGSVQNLTASSDKAERAPAWSPDGEKICWLTEFGDGYRLTIHSLSSGSEKTWQLPEQDRYYYEPVWSPDERHIALVGKGLRLWLIDINSGNARLVATSPYALQTTFNASWSPDGAYLAFNMDCGNGNGAIYLHEVATGQTHQVTPGIRNASNPTFTNDGAELYYLRDHPRGAPLSAFALSSMLHQEYDLREIWHMPLAAALDGHPKPGEALPLPQHNIREIYPAGRYALFVDVSLKKESLDSDGSDTSIFQLDLNTLKAQQVAENVSASTSNDFHQLVSRSGFTVNTRAAGGNEAHSFDLRRITVQAHPRQEWTQIFNEAIRIQEDWFYDPGLNGQDAELLREHFSAYLPNLRSRYGLNLVLRELISHLAASHMGVGGGIPSAGRDERIGVLGADFAVVNGAWQVAKIYRGDPMVHDITSPLATPSAAVEEGMYLLAVNGTPLDIGKNVYAQLAGTAGLRTELTVATEPDGSGAREITVAPLDNDDFLRWMTWVAERREIVRRATDGKLAYIYIEDFRDRGLNSVIQQFWAQRDAEGIIVDQRFARGGQSGDIFIDMLRRQRTFRYIFRAGSDQPFPMGTTPGPRVLLTNEWNTSSADTFPQLFRGVGLGPIVGRAPYGAAIGGYYPLPRFIDGGGMGSVNRAILDETTGTWLENHPIIPDYRVFWDRAAWLRGKDPQLEKAIEIALAEIRKNPEKPVQRPAYPVYK